MANLFASALNPTTWGPAYWKTTYGYATFEDFFADADEILDGFAVFGISPPNELVARTAWYDPVSAPGTYLTARLLIKGNDGAAWASALRTASDNINRASVSLEENTMAQLVIPNCFQVSIEAIVGGRNVFNVIGVQNAGGTAAGAAAATKAAWEVANGPLKALSNLVAMVEYHSVDIGSTSGDIVDLASTAIGGISAAPSLATRGACALIKWNGSTRSRSSRGRLYFGPILEANINADGATLVPTSLTTIDTAFTNFRNSLNSAGYPLVVLSRTLQTAYPVTQHAVESTIATQRRRIRS